jgi:hypothetical protein
MELKSLIGALSLAGMILQGGLVVVLLGRKAWRRYPLFTSYGLFSFVTSVMLYFLRRPAILPPHSYFYSYWIQEAIAMVLGFCVVYEVFQHLFSAHKALLKLASLIFRWTVAALFGLALVVVFVQSPSAASLGKTVLVLEEATRIVEVGLLMFLFGASAAFGLHWKQAEFGIALGLGLFVAVQLTTVTLLSQIGMRASEMLSIVSILAFDTSLLVWLGYLLAPERVTSAGDIPKRAQLEQWNQAVTELISR